MGDHPQYRTILTADIEGYGRPARTNPERVKLRRHLAGWCDDLLGKAGVRADQWCRQDTGDGWIVSIDPHLPRDVLLVTFLVGLRRRLARYNSGRPTPRQVRVRLAVHGGDVLPDPDPLVGEAVNLACRLRDAPAVRARLGVTVQPLALVVSEAIYDEIVKHGYSYDAQRLDPSEWHPVVAETKEGARRPWVHVPRDPEAPRRAGVAAAASGTARSIAGEASSLSSNERPPHWANVTSLWLGRFPVTNAQYQVFAEATGSRAPLSLTSQNFADPRQPVVGIAWDEARAFCSWLSLVSGRRVDLPSEAQWEYAARGPESLPYPWGEQPPNPSITHYGLPPQEGRTLSVDALPQSEGPFGARQQLGNVWEWCIDEWLPEAYSGRTAGAPTDPVVLGDGRSRAVRGAGWQCTTERVHAAHRCHNNR